MKLIFAAFSLAGLGVVSLWGEPGRPPIVTVGEVLAQSEDRLTKGTWGGDRISMEVTDDGARIEYDCAHGTISDPVFMDKAGKFSAKGFYVQERGGPLREGDEEKKGEPVVYSGTIEGKNMTLKVTSERGKLIGVFGLTLGKMSRLHKCL